MNSLMLTYISVIYKQNIFSWDSIHQKIAPESCTLCMYQSTSTSHAHFHAILEIHNVENINDNDNSQQMLQGIVERDNCKLISSVPCRYLVSRESRFTWCSTQLKHLSIDNTIIIIIIIIIIIVVVSKNSTSSNEDNNPCSMET